MGWLCFGCVLDNWTICCLPGDLTLADRSFNIDESESICSAQIKITVPPFNRGKKTQLSQMEVDTSCQLSSEQVIGVLRQKYTILEGKMPINMLMTAASDYSTIIVVHSAIVVTPVVPFQYKYTFCMHVYIKIIMVIRTWTWSFCTLDNTSFFLWVFIHIDCVKPKYGALGVITGNHLSWFWLLTETSQLLRVCWQMWWITFMITWCKDLA